jgi:hypothetical protein
MFNVLKHTCRAFNIIVEFINCMNTEKISIQGDNILLLATTKVSFSVVVKGAKHEEWPTIT